MPDQQTIDRIDRACVGLAEIGLCINDLTGLRCVGNMPSVGVYTVLLMLLDIPTQPIPDWAERALEEHAGPPEELVETLRELAARVNKTANKMQCPQCSGPIEKVRQPAGSSLNSNQFESVKAGDFICRTCPDNGRGQSGMAYFWNRELMQPKGEPE